MTKIVKSNKKIILEVSRVEMHIINRALSLLYLNSCDNLAEDKYHNLYDMTDDRLDKRMSSELLEVLEDYAE